MYKVFGDGTGVQVFNGQPNSLNIDGSTTGVPNSDQVRVERVFFNWNNIGGSKLYLSIGRRPLSEVRHSTSGMTNLVAAHPPARCLDFQYDGMTVGYHVTDKMTLRACYGLGYSSGFGNGNLIKTPADRLKDVHLFGGVFDLYETDHTFVQALVARAWNVTDGFNGLVVMPNNPLTGDPITAPVIMRYTPSANLGAIDLYVDLPGFCSPQAPSVTRHAGPGRTTHFIPAEGAWHFEGEPFSAPGNPESRWRGERSPERKRRLLLSHSARGEKSLSSHT